MCTNNLAIIEVGFGHPSGPFGGKRDMEPQRKLSAGQQRIVSCRRLQLVECIEIFLRSTPGTYAVQFDGRKTQLQFAYSWKAIICKN